MKLEIKVFENLCRLSEFMINNTKADLNDFVIKYDRAPEEAEDYGCGDMQATKIPESNRILRRYRINSDEYIEIADNIIEKVSFGHCGLCI